MTLHLAQLDLTPAGGHPIAEALRWLDTLIDSPVVQWNAEQRNAAIDALSGARELMATDVLTLAGRVYPNAAPQATKVIARSGEGVDSLRAELVHTDWGITR